MDKKELLKTVDHTLLTQTATWTEIRQILDDGIAYGTASACIPASYVKQAADYVNGKLPICTVIGFPNGYHTTAVKVYETKDAIANGAAEIDMVINIGAVKDQNYGLVKEDIRAVVEASKPAIVKVIVETCLLTDEEKEKVCELSVEAGAAFVKTSTGFSTGGATVADIALMRKTVKDRAKVKASGGIRTPQDAKALLEAGADRIGAGNGVVLL